MGVVGFPDLVILALILFLAAYHPVPAGEGIHRFIACVFNRAFMEIVVEFGTDYACIGVLLKHFYKSFKQARGEFRVVIYNKEVLALCGPDTDIIAATEAKVSIVTDDLYRRINMLKDRRGVCL